MLKRSTYHLIQNVIVSGAILLPSLAIANCDAILSQAMYNIQISQSAEASTATKYYNNCGKTYSSLSESQLIQAEVEVFGFGGGGGAYSRSQREERLNQWCTTNKETAERNQDSYNESQTIYAGSVQAWENCNALESRDVQIDPNVSSDQKIVDFAMRYTGATSSGVIFFGAIANGFTCTTKSFDTATKKVIPFDPTTPPEIGRINVPVHCIRKAAVKKVINGQQYTYLAAGNITLQTGSYNVVMSFPEIYNPSLPEQKAVVLEQKLDDLEQKSSDLKALIDTNTENIANLGSRTTSLECVNVSDSKAASYFGLAGTRGVACPASYSLTYCYGGDNRMGYPQANNVCVTGAPDWAGAVCCRTVTK